MEMKMKKIVSLMIVTLLIILSFPNPVLSAEIINSRKPITPGHSVYHWDRLLKLFNASPFSTIDVNTLPKNALVKYRTNIGKQVLGSCAAWASYSAFTPVMYRFDKNIVRNATDVIITDLNDKNLDTYFYDFHYAFNPTALYNDYYQHDSAYFTDAGSIMDDIAAHIAMGHFLLMSENDKTAYLGAFNNPVFYGEHNTVPFNVFVIRDKKDYNKFITDVKKVVASGIPVMTSIYTSPAFNQVTYDNPFYVIDKKGKGHTVTIVGYNDEEKYFIFQNSWGKQYGRHGLFYVRYSDLPKTLMA